jgi:hypothetical protein
MEDRELEFFLRIGRQEPGITPSEVVNLLLGGIRSMNNPLA